MKVFILSLVVVLSGCSGWGFKFNEPQEVTIHDPVRFSTFKFYPMRGEPYYGNEFP